MKQTSPTDRGAPLFDNSDDTLSGRFAGMPMFDYVAEFDSASSEVVVQMLLAGHRAPIGDAMRFPFEAGATELVCKTDPSVILVRTQSQKAPYTLQRRYVALTGSDPW